MIFVLQREFSSCVQVFDDYPKLNKVLAVYYEALRMFRELDVLTGFLSFSLNIYFTTGSPWTYLDARGC